MGGSFCLHLLPADSIESIRSVRGRGRGLVGRLEHASSSRHVPAFVPSPVPPSCPPLRSTVPVTKSPSWFVPSLVSSCFSSPSLPPRSSVLVLEFYRGVRSCDGCRSPTDLRRLDDVSCILTAQKSPATYRWGDQPGLGVSGHQPRDGSPGVRTCVTPATPASCSANSVAASRRPCVLQMCACAFPTQIREGVV